MRATYNARGGMYSHCCCMLTGWRSPCLISRPDQGHPVHEHSQGIACHHHPQIRRGRQVTTHAHVAHACDCQLPACLNGGLTRCVCLCHMLGQWLSRSTRPPGLSHCRKTCAKSISHAMAVSVAVCTACVCGIAPPPGPITNSNNTSVARQIYSGDIEMNLNLFLRPQVAAEELQVCSLCPHAAFGLVEECHGID